jgi:hypothetical protein
MSIVPAVANLAQKFTDGIFRDTESAKAELNHFELAIFDPTVNGFGVDAGPLRHFGYGQ